MVAVRWPGFAASQLMDLGVLVDVDMGFGLRVGRARHMVCSGLQHVGPLAESVPQIDGSFGHILANPLLPE